MNIKVIPGSRGLVSFCVLWADEYGKIDLCHGLKLTALSMLGGYLATESSHDTFMLCELT